METKKSEQIMELNPAGGSSASAGGGCYFSSSKENVLGASNSIFCFMPSWDPSCPLVITIMQIATVSISGGTGDKLYRQSYDNYCKNRRGCVKRGVEEGGKRITGLILLICPPFNLSICKFFSYALFVDHVK